MLHATKILQNFWLTQVVGQTWFFNLGLATGLGRDGTSKREKQIYKYFQF